MEINDFIPLGSHLVSPRRGFDHHGIYVGSGMVVHYAGMATDLKSAPVKQDTIDGFANGRGFKIIENDGVTFTGAEIAERAHSRIGENRYNVLFNNCEHFCHWCIFDHDVSHQVRKGVTAVSSFIASRYLVSAGAAALGATASPLAATVLTALALNYGVRKLSKKWAKRNGLDIKPQPGTAVLIEPATGPQDIDFNAYLRLKDFALQSPKVSIDE